MSPRLPGKSGPAVGDAADSSLTRRIKDSRCKFEQGLTIPRSNSPCRRPSAHSPVPCQGEPAGRRRHPSSRPPVSHQQRPAAGPGPAGRSPACRVCRVGAAAGAWIPCWSQWWLREAFTVSPPAPDLEREGRRVASAAPGSASAESENQEQAEKEPQWPPPASALQTNKSQRLEREEQNWLSEACLSTQRGLPSPEPLLRETPLLLGPCCRMYRGLCSTSRRPSVREA